VSEITRYTTTTRARNLKSASGDSSHPG